MADNALSRRSVVRTALFLGGGSLAAGLVGCSDPAPPATISPDQAALDAAALGERALVALLANGVTRATPAQIRRAEAASAAHSAHAAELVAAGAAANSSPATGSSGSPTAQPAAVPDPSAVVAAQVAQADALTRAALGVSPRIARLLGSIAASDAAHASLMRQGR